MNYETRAPQIGTPPLIGREKWAEKQNKAIYEDFTQMREHYKQRKVLFQGAMPTTKQIRPGCNVNWKIFYLYQSKRYLSLSLLYESIWYTFCSSFYLMEYDVNKSCHILTQSSMQIGRQSRIDLDLWFTHKYQIGQTFFRAYREAGQAQYFFKYMSFQGSGSSSPCSLARRYAFPGLTAMTIKKDLSLRKGLKLTLRVLCVGNLFYLYQFFS